MQALPPQCVVRVGVYFLSHNLFHSLAQGALRALPQAMMPFARVFNTISFDLRRRMGHGVFFSSLKKQTRGNAGLLCFTCNQQSACCVTRKTHAANIHTNNHR